MRHGEDGPPPGTPPSVRGRLSEVFFTALVGDQKEALLRRLGDRASVDEPVFGMSSGRGLSEHVARLVGWLSERDAKYVRGATTVGTSIDATLGVLELREGDGFKSAPVLVVIERRREREVVVRVHLGASRLGITRKGPSAVEGASQELSGVVRDAVSALFGGAKAPCFEQDAKVVDAKGEEHTAASFGDRKLGARAAHSLADDGRVAVVELEGGAVALERGDSGMVRVARLYTDD